MAPITAHSAAKPLERPEIRLAQPFCQPRRTAIVIPMAIQHFQGDRMRRLIFAVCLAGAPLLATGQSMIYKVQMPDGSVLYSDSVPSGGKVLEEREAKSTPRVNSASYSTRPRPTPPTAGAGTRQGSIAAARPPANKGAPSGRHSDLGTRARGREKTTRTRARAAARRKTWLSRWRQPADTGVRSAHRCNGARSRGYRSEAEERVRVKVMQCPHSGRFCIRILR